MKQIKNHWPIIVTVIIWIVSVLGFRVINTNSSDALGQGLLFFYILMPLCALTATAWYGYKIRRNSKWLIIIIFGVLEVLVITSSTGDWDFGYYWSMAFWTLIPAAIGMIIGTLIRKKRKDEMKGS